MTYHASKKTDFPVDLIWWGSPQSDIDEDGIVAAMYKTGMIIVDTFDIVMYVIEDHKIYIFIIQSPNRYSCSIATYTKVILVRRCINTYNTGVVLLQVLWTAFNVLHPQLSQVVSVVHVHQMTIVKNPTAQFIIIFHIFINIWVGCNWHSGEWTSSYTNNVPTYILYTVCVHSQCMGDDVSSEW